MYKHLTCALLLVGCYSAVPAEVPVGDTVPAAVVARAVADIEECTGRECDLDGWSVWYAANEDADKRFWCAEAGECGPRPAGCERDADCPCRCAGFSRFGTMQIIVTRDLRALKHELLHACYDLADHDGPEWTCQ